MKKAIAILAAGIGSRYGGLKQMDPFGPSGEFIIDYTVYDALRAGFDKIVFIIRHDIEEAFKDSIGRRIADHVDTSYAFQELDDLPGEARVPAGRTKPWGTVQALLTCADLLHSPYAILNADDFYGKASFKLLSHQLDRIAAGEGNACMVGFQLDHTLSKHGSVTRGICESDKTGMLKNITEISEIQCLGDTVVCSDASGHQTSLDSHSLASMNMWGFDTSLFDAFREEFATFLQREGHELKSELVIPTAVNTLIAKGSVTCKVLDTPSTWFGVTYPDDKPVAVDRLKNLIKAGEYPESLWARTLT